MLTSLRCNSNFWHKGKVFLSWLWQKCNNGVEWKYFFDLWINFSRYFCNQTRKRVSIYVTTYIHAFCTVIWYKHKTYSDTKIVFLIYYKTYVTLQIGYDTCYENKCKPNYERIINLHFYSFAVLCIFPLLFDDDIWWQLGWKSVNTIIANNNILQNIP